MLIGTPILMIGVYRSFFPETPASEQSLLVSLLILYVGWTMLSLAHTAWSSELSTDYNERSRIMGIVHFTGLTGAIVVLVTPAIVEYATQVQSMQARAEIMGYIVLCSLPIFAIISVFTVSNKVKAASITPVNRREAMFALIKNKPLRRLLIIDFLLGFQGGVNGSVHFFYVAQVLELPKAAALYLVLILFSGLVCVPLFVQLSYRLGKHRTLSWGAILSSVSTASLYFLAPGAFWPALVVFVSIGFIYGAKDFLIRSIMADIIDVDRNELGTERSALFYSFLTLTAKLGLAFAVGLLYPILDWVGFKPGAVNEPNVIEGVKILVAVTPTLATISVALIMWNFPLNKKQQEEIRSSIDREVA